MTDPDHYTERYAEPKQKAVDVRFFNKDGKPFVCTCDVGVCIGRKSNPYAQWQKRTPELEDRRINDKVHRPRGLIMIPVEDALGHLADSKRALPGRVQRFVKWLSETTGVEARAPPPPVEVVWVEAIMKGTADVWQREVCIDKYRVDLYSAKHGIVVEIDEDGHRNYSKEKETARTRALKKAGVKAIVRFNPHDHETSIFAAVANLALAVGAAEIPGWDLLT